MSFTQSEIDSADVYYELHNNPGGGNGDDYTAICTVAEDPNNPGEPLWWQSSDDETAEEFVRHKIGLIRAFDENVAFIVCTEAGEDYTLTIPSFSEISDEVVVHRVFCAALRPTSSGFTFANPIKDITVAASPDTVNVQTVALDAYKTVKTTDTVTVTHTQDFPCIFGICYKHKSNGEITGVTPQPEPSVTVFRATFNFRLNDKVNFIHATIDGVDEAMAITRISISSLNGFVKYQGLACLSSDGRDEILEGEVDGYDINSFIKQEMQNRGGIQNITSPVTIMTTALGVQRDPDQEPVGCMYDVVLTVFYKPHRE